MSVQTQLMHRKCAIPWDMQVLSKQLMMARLHACPVKFHINDPFTLNQIQSFQYTVLSHANVSTKWVAMFAFVGWMLQLCHENRDSIF